MPFLKVNRRWVFVGSLFLVFVAVSVGGYLWHVTTEETEHLGEARLLSRGADGPPYERTDNYSSVDELPIEDSSMVRTASDSGFILVTIEPIAEVDARGNVNHAARAATARHSKIAVGVEGEIAFAPALHTIHNEVWFFQPTDGQYEYEREVVDLCESPIQECNQAGSISPPEAIAFSPDDGDLFQSRPLEHEAGIDVLRADRTEMSRFLGQPGDDDAEIELNEPLDRITSLLALPDDRLIFVADHPNRGRELYLLENGEIATIDDVSVQTVRETPSLARPIDHLDRGPDGTVLVVGMTTDDGSGHPRISQLDPDTGEAETLIDLEGVEASVDFPVSAAAVGDDLVFLAEGKLWILEDAFAGTEG